MLPAYELHLPHMNYTCDRLNYSCHLMYYTFYLMNCICHLMNYICHLMSYTCHLKNYTCHLWIILATDEFTTLWTTLATCELHLPPMNYIYHIMTYTIVTLLTTPLYPEWPHRQGEIKTEGRMLTVAGSNPGCGWAAPISTMYEALRGYCPWRWGATSQFNWIYRQLNLLSLFLAGCGRLQLGVPHFVFNYCK